MTAYQPGIPTGTVNLDVDYKNIKNNFGQLDTTYGTDHVPYSQALNNGFHNIIREVPFSTTASNPPKNQPVAQPAATPGIGTLFTAEVNDGVSIDTALYYLTGANKLQQLTRNLVPVGLTNGYTFLTGGFILQWGIVNGTTLPDNHFSPGVSNSVNFSTNNIAFPNNCFTIWTQGFYKTTNLPTNAATFAILNTFSKTGFVWRAATQSVAYTSFMWIALGN